MKPRHAAILAALAGILGARRSLAAAPACAQITVETTAGVRARWPELPASIREALSARDDLDRCARVTVDLSGARIALGVVLPDGRSATRSVAHKEDVAPVLAGLLLVPDPPGPPADAEATPDDRTPSARPAPAAATTAATTTGTVTVTVTAAATAVETRVPASAPAGPPASLSGAAAQVVPGTLGVELSVATGGRVGDGQAGLGVAALSFVEMAGWLAGFEGRVDGYQRFTGDAPTGALEIAVLGGRRIRPTTPSTLALDLFAGVALALQGTSKSVKQVGSTDPAVTTSRSRAAPRLRVGARLDFRALSTLRPFVGVDGELGRTYADPTGDLPSLPAWTVGLALGATVGTR